MRLTDVVFGVVTDVVSGVVRDVVSGVVNDVVSEVVRDVVSERMAEDSHSLSFWVLMLHFCSNKYNNGGHLFTWRHLWAPYKNEPINAHNSFQLTRLTS